MKVKLFRRKKNAVDEPVRRIVRPQASGRPDLIYYTNRRSRPTTEQEGASSRSRSLLNAPVGTVRPAKLRRKPLFWLAAGAVAFLIFQVTMLGGSSKVIVLQDGAGLAESATTYENTVNKLLKTSLFNRSKITIDTRGIATELRRLHPEIESAIMTVPLFGGQSTVYVALSEPVFVLQQGTNRYTLSASGYITSAASDDIDLPLVQDDTGETVSIGKQLLPRSTVQFMKTVHYQFAQTDIKVNALVLPAKKAYEVNARLEGKPYIIRFNLQEDALQQSGAAIATIEQLGSTVPTGYLDVRVPGRIYYK